MTSQSVGYSLLIVIYGAPLLNLPLLYVYYVGLLGAFCY